MVRRLPRGAALALGRMLGSIYARFDKRHVAIAIGNLRHAFPEWPEARTLATARGVYRHFGQVIFDLLWMQGRSRDELLRIVEFVGREHIEKALAHGKGFICSMGHFGNWEAHGVAHAHAFGPSAVVGRPLDNPALEARLLAWRESSGNTVISKRRALPDILRCLRSNRALGVLMDQNVQEGDGIFVTFFGRPASTTTVVAALAAKTGCAVVPGHCVVLPDGRCQVIYEPPIFFDGALGRDAGIRQMTQHLTSRIEAWVRDHPEQWLWIHRRWKTQPGPGGGK